MRLAERYAVAEELALLYDFVNTLDRRRYVEQGVAHTGGDELATSRQLEAWMRRRRLLGVDEHITAKDHRRARDLRDALRAFLELSPSDRKDPRAARWLTTASRDFPLTLVVANNGAVMLQAAPGSSALGRVLAEVYGLARTGQLARLKACASEECRWIFFVRSKPANRHWCSSKLCGNRQKTRTYRRKHREALQSLPTARRRSQRT
ncbi:MAG: CGNR zinc finger domain-containing protein [Vicinamibacteraceae bacterium]